MHHILESISQFANRGFFRRTPNLFEKEITDFFEQIGYATSQMHIVSLHGIGSVFFSPVIFLGGSREARPNQRSDK